MNFTRNDIHGWIPEGSALDNWVGSLILIVVSAVALVFVVAPVTSGLLTLAERKVAGHIQARYGPNRILGHGFTQWVADGLKLLLKEDLIPEGVDPILFRFAPYLVMLATALVLVAIPFGPQLMAVDLNLGILYVMAAASIAVVGILMSGWASNNKWSLLGGLRSAAQIVSYELPNAMAVIPVILVTGSLSMQSIVGAQGGGGGVLGWNLFQSPFMFICFFIYFISAIAENNRIPFDMPEAESELVSGYNTEYSGMRFAVFFLAEFANVFVISLLATMLFLGGWQGPGMSALQPGIAQNLLGVFYVMAKSTAIMIVILQLRWTIPRLRVDQVMNLCWKYLLPIALVCVVFTAVQVVLPKNAQWILIASGWGLLALWVSANLYRTFREKRIETA